MSRAYVPRGHVGLVEAAKIVARSRNPERWQSERMLTGEQDIWDRLDAPGGYRPEIIDQHLQAKIPENEPRTNGLHVERLCDFREAQEEIWHAIGDGLIEVSYTDDDGGFRAIPAQGWRTSGGLEAIRTGRVTLDLPTEYLTAYPWVSEASIVQHLASYGNTVDSSIDAERSSSTGALETRAEKLLAEWWRSMPESQRSAVSRDAAAAFLKETGASLGKRAFDRVWPKARARAGLPERAPAGAKPKGRLISPP